MRRTPGWCAALLVAAATAGAAHWPQWRGPLLNGSTTATGLPARWSKTDNVAWVTPMPGPGAATPIVWGDRVFVSAADRKGKATVGLCLDAGGGTVLWTVKLGAERQVPGRNNMASPSAVTDGSTAWFYTGAGDLVACDFAGKELWRRQLQEDLGPFAVRYGYSSSPLLYGDRLYIPVLRGKDPNRFWKSGHQGELPSLLLGIDPKTGKTLWKQVRETDATGDARHAYITPIPHHGDGRHEVIVVGGECATGHAAATGRELWRWRFPGKPRRGRQRLVPSAVAGDGLIYVCRCRHQGLFALEAGGEGSLGEEQVAWRFHKATPDVATPLLMDGRLYVLQDRRRQAACLDARTGTVLWTGKLPASGTFFASPTGADGKVYLLSTAGDVVVLAAGDAFQILANFSLGERDCKSSIAIAGDRLFVRTGQNLYCVAKGE